MARIMGNYVTRLGADDVRIARCGRHAWVRLTSKHGPTDLFFDLGSTHQQHPRLESDAVLSAAV